MHGSLPRVIAARMLSGAIAALLLAGCGASPVAPTATRLQSTQRASHDDPPPPDLPCRSGWILQDGVWTCTDP